MKRLVWSATVLSAVALAGFGCSKESRQASTNKDTAKVSAPGGPGGPSGAGSGQGTDGIKRPPPPPPPPPGK